MTTGENVVKVEDRVALSPSRLREGRRLSAGEGSNAAVKFQFLLYKPATQPSLVATAPDPPTSGRVTSVRVLRKPPGEREHNA